MTVIGINDLSEFQYPSFLQSCLNNKGLAVCAASIGITFLSGFFLYRYLMPLNSPSMPNTTNLSNYVVVTPSAFRDSSKAEQMRKLYCEAKKIITALPEDFRSKVDFDDQNLEIGFKYEMMALKGLINHKELWFIFSSEEAFKPFSTDHIFESGSTRFVVKNLDRAFVKFLCEREDFRKKAENFFKNEAVIKKIPDFEGESFRNCTDLVMSIFKESKGLSFGDIHSQIQPKYFLISQMQTLVKNNVEVLFMEGLFESQQEDLDIYFDSQTDVEAIPLSIRYNYCCINETLKAAGGYTLIDVLQHAKLAGIKRVVAIDTQLGVFNLEDEKSRISIMNYFAKQIIDKEMPKGNYVIFSGAAHAASAGGTDTPSFSQLFGIPSIYVHDGRFFMISNNQNRKIRTPIVGHPDATLRCNFSIAIPAKTCKK